MIRLDQVFNEPMLEFGGHGMSCDIREGILMHGPVDIGTPKATTAIKVGLVGSPKDISAFTAWMKECEAGIEGDDPINHNFSPGFPGLAPAIGFGCSFLTDKAWTTEVADSEIEALLPRVGVVLRLAEFYHARIRDLYELTSAKPDVVLCLPSEAVQQKVKPRFGGEDESDEEQTESDLPDFHDYLKGLCLQTKSIFQMIWPRTYGNSGND